MTRDPRTDPRPGDVLQKGRTRRVVRHLAGPDSTVYYNHGDYTADHSTTATNWHKWAACAEVIHVSED